MKIYTILLCFGLFLISCKEKKNKTIVDSETLNLKQIPELQNREMLVSYGNFDDETVNIKVPVSSDKFKIVETRNISSKEVNCIAVRVTNNKTTPITATQPTHIAKKTEKVSDLKLDPKLLMRDKKIKVITFNSTKAFTKEELATLEKCIEPLKGYDTTSCNDAIRPFGIHEIDKEKDVSPNTRKGSIILGFNQ